MPTFFEFWSDQWLRLPLVISPETCTGKTYIVTGANVGLGYEAAKHLVAAGAKKVILGVRNLESGNAARASISKATGRDDAATAVWSLDLSNSTSVKAFAQRATSELDRIDGIIENAGVALPTWTTSEGWETSILVNVINTFLLAVLILPKMSESARKYGGTPGITIVSSSAGFRAVEEFHRIKDDPFVKMNDRELANMMQRYPLSKLVEIFIVRQLALVAPQSRTGVFINDVSPGLCRTQLARNVPFRLALPIYILRLLCGRSAEAGSRTLLHAVTAGKESHGCYLSSCEIREKDLDDWITGEDGNQAGKRMWNDLVGILEKIEPGCIKRIS